MEMCKIFVTIRERVMFSKLVKLKYFKQLGK